MAIHTIIAGTFQSHKVNWLMILFPSIFRKPLLSLAYCLYCASNWKPYQVKQRNFKAKAVNVNLQSKKVQAFGPPFSNKKERVNVLVLPRVKFQPQAGQF